MLCLSIIFSFTIIFNIGKSNIFFVNSKEIENKSIIIYIAAHKDFQPKLTNKIYQIITDSKSSLNDTYNLNIIYSDKNNELYLKNHGYCECSKLYYIWKNIRPLPKYIGFIHYRAYFKFFDQIPDLEKIFQKYDVILPKFVNNKENLKETFEKMHIPVFDDVTNIIKEIKPEYYNTAIEVLSKKKFYYKNMFIMKKEDFLEYGKFVFDVIMEFDKKHNLKTDEDIEEFVSIEISRYHKKIRGTEYQKRLEGFIIERLSNIFFTHKFKNIFEIEAVGYDIFDFNEERNFINICRDNTLFQPIPIESLKPKISVVLPIYNKEKYLLTAIRSIQNQNFKDFEVILVDDFSKDNSLNIMQEEALKDKRIKIVKNEKNRGTLFSRFNGARHANGKYLIQLDPDDAFCNPYALSLLYNIIENKKVDIVHFSAITGSVNSLEKFNDASITLEELIIQPELKHYLKKNLNKSLYEWNKIYKTKIYLKAFDFIGKEYYEEHHCFLQDKIVTFSILHVAESAYTIQDNLIWYNINEDSGVNTPYNDKKIYDAYRTFVFLSDHSENNIEDKLEFIKALERFLKHRKFVKGVAKSKKYKGLYLNLSKKHIFSSYLPSFIRRMLLDFLIEIGF